MRKIVLIILFLMTAGSAFGQGTPISALPSATTPLAGTEVAPIVQGGVTKKVALSPTNIGAVSSVGLSLPGIFTVSGSPVTSPTGTFTVTGNGTSGGIPYFSGTTTMASSGLLSANQIVLGGGAGVSPSVLSSLGTTVTVLHGNASGAPSFGAVNLATDVSGTLPASNISLTLANGLTGAATPGSPLGPNSLFRNVSGTTDTITTSDSATVVHYSSGSAIATAVPAAGTSGYPSGFQFGVQADGAGTITLTPASGTIHSSSTFTVAQNTGCSFTSDGTSDWKIDSCNAIGGSSFGGITTSGSAFTGNGTSGSPLAANFGTSSGTIAQGNAVLPLAGGTMTGAILSTNTGSSGSPMYALNGTGTGMFGSTSAQISSNSVTRISFLSTGPTLLSSFTSVRNVDSQSPQFELMFNGAEGTTANDTIAYSTTSAVGGFVGVGHSKSGTIGTNTTLASGDRMGRFGFFGADGTNLTTGADILGEVDGTVATSQVPGRITLRTANASGTLTNGFKIDSKQHKVYMGPAPTSVTCGGNAATTVGNDSAGRITAPATPGTSCTITFAGSFTTNAPVCNATDETLGLNMPVTSVSTSAVTFTLATLAVSNAVSYICVGFE